MISPGQILYCNWKSCFIDGEIYKYWPGKLIEQQKNERKIATTELQADKMDQSLLNTNRTEGRENHAGRRDN
jgi:hypothetical protein